MAKAEVDAQVQDIQLLLENWTQEVTVLRSRYQWLLYLNMPKLMQLYHILHNVLTDSRHGVDSILHEVSFLALNNNGERQKLRKEVKVSSFRRLKHVIQNNILL